MSAAVAATGAKIDLDKIAEGIEFVHNRYTKTRGTPALLKLMCSNCNTFVAFYQKDGRGKLLRLYRDRIHYPIGISSKEHLVCQVCSQVLGTSMIYQLEQRPAFHLKHGSVIHTKVKQ